MTAYRKKPVVIEARGPVTRENGMSIANWCGGAESFFGDITILTLEGTMNASPGDYVIRGVQGEFYPCKPDVFEATYERVGESE